MTNDRQKGQTAEIAMLDSKESVAPQLGQS
jgi:hypothetical protein